MPNSMFDSHATHKPQQERQARNSMLLGGLAGAPHVGAAPLSMLQKIQRDDATYEDIEPDMLERGLLDGSGDRYRSARSAARRLFPITQSHYRETVDRAASRASADMPMDVILRDVRMRRNFDRISADLLDKKQRAETFRERSGLSIGLPKDGEITLRDKDRNAVLDLPEDTVMALRDRESFQPALDVIRGIQGNATPDEIKALTEKAIAAQTGEAVAIDSWIVGDPDDRKAIILRAADALRAGDLSPDRRRAQMSTAAAALFAEALPANRAAMMLLDIAPFSALIRDGDRASTAAAEGLKAYQEGRFLDAIKHGIEMQEYMATALMSAVPGGKILAKGAKHVIGKTKVGAKVLASHQVGKAMRRDVKDSEEISARALLGQEYDELREPLQKYTRAVLNAAAGKVSEAQMAGALEKAGFKLLKNNKNPDDAHLRITLPESGRTRVLDFAIEDQEIKKILGAAIPKSKPGNIIGGEVKSGGSLLTSAQERKDKEIIQLTQQQRAKQQYENDALEDRPIGMGHNAPPSDATLTVETPAPRPHSQSGTRSLDNALAENDGFHPVDEMSLLRVGLQDMDPRQLADAFEAYVRKPGLTAQKRIASGVWSKDEVEKMVTIIRKAARDRALEPLRSALVLIIAADAIRTARE